LFDAFFVGTVFADLTTQSSGALLDALGVDFAAAMVEQATRLNPKLTFKGSAEELPFPDECFDGSDTTGQAALSLGARMR